MCQAYRQQYGLDAICTMPTNLYGPGDIFHPENSHVVPALIRRIHEAKLHNIQEVVIWGSGQPLREFLHVDDLADALLFLMGHYTGNDIINVGSGEEVSIADLAHCIAGVIGYDGKLTFDPSKPDGTQRKLLDTSRLEELGWNARIALNAGLSDAHRWLTTHQSEFSA